MITLFFVLIDSSDFLDDDLLINNRGLLNSFGKGILVNLRYIPFPNSINSSRFCGVK